MNRDTIVTFLAIMLWIAVGALLGTVIGLLYLESMT